MKTVVRVAALSCTCAALALPGAVRAGPVAEASDVVGRGRAEFELGRSTESDRGTRTGSTPLQLKLGVLDALELRLASEGAITVHDQGATERGFADASLGFKWRLREAGDGGPMPGLAVLASVDADTGSAAFRGQGWRPSLRLYADWQLPGDLLLAVAPGVAWDRDDSGRRFAAGSVALAMTAMDVVPGWHGFVELAADRLASKRYGGRLVTFGFGVVWEVNDLLQLELQTARGRNDRTPARQSTLMAVLRF